MSDYLRIRNGEIPLGFRVTMTEGPYRPKFEQFQDASTIQMAAPGLYDFGNARWRAINVLADLSFISIRVKVQDNRVCLQFVHLDEGDWTTLGEEMICALDTPVQCKFKVEAVWEGTVKPWNSIKLGYKCGDTSSGYERSYYYIVEAAPGRYRYQQTEHDYRFIEWRNGTYLYMTGDAVRFVFRENKLNDSCFFEQRDDYDGYYQCWVIWEGEEE